MTNRRTLAEEHAELLREVGARRDRVLAALGGGQWPQPEIEGLLGYLRYELLDQAVNEERLLYPLTGAGFADERVRQLAVDHAQLRDCADAVARAAAADRALRDREHLTATLDELHERLVGHLNTEEELLGAGGAGVEDLRQPFRSHEWFALTEGPRVDMDRLPREYAVAAVMDRLTRLRPGECIELTSGEPVEPLEDLIVRRDMAADYGWVYLDEGPERWRATITRRSPSG